MSCAHTVAAVEPTPLTTQGCQECLKLGEHNWVHLRLCMSCGNLACCDSSPHKHATAHFKETQHPVMRSFQPGESWRWCFVDETIG